MKKVIKPSKDFLERVKNLNGRTYRTRLYDYSYIQIYPEGVEYIKRVDRSAYGTTDIYNSDACVYFDI